MPFVMVPVPAEHEKEFGEWLLTRTLQAKLSEWPEGAVAELLGHADDQVQKVLVHLAKAGDLWAKADKVAAIGGLQEAELLERLKAMTEISMTRHWPALVMIKTEAPTKGSAAPTQSLLMPGPVRTEVIRILGG